MFKYILYQNRSYPQHEELWVALSHAGFLGSETILFPSQTAEYVECEFLSILELWPWDSNWVPI